MTGASRVMLIKCLSSQYKKTNKCILQHVTSADTRVLDTIDLDEEGASSVE